MLRGVHGQADTRFYLIKYGKYGLSEHCLWDAYPCVKPVYKTARKGVFSALSCPPETVMSAATFPEKDFPIHEPAAMHRGVKILHDPIRNKGTAFTEKDRDLLGLRGLLPPRVLTMEEQCQRALASVRR